MKSTLPLRIMDVACCTKMEWQRDLTKLVIHKITLKKQVNLRAVYSDSSYPLALADCMGTEIIISPSAGVYYWQRAFRWAPIGPGICALQ